MLLEQKNKLLENLKARADVLTTIRNFFAKRNVLEVETPLLSHSTVTDPHVHGIPVGDQFLQTSPEYAMKRLLAAGSGSIYQICKAFRHNDYGQLHNSEFTMLEWYQVGFDHHDLMDEMDELLQQILKVSAAERRTCQAVYEEFLGINPHSVSESELAACAAEKINFTQSLPNTNAWLDLLFTHCIQPHLGSERPFFLYDFPISQAALAKIRPENPAVASRFEVYFKGIELANGFHELQDAAEQRKRFENDLIFRAKNNLPILPIDEKFLAALEHGLPDCAGVALGVDRLIMLQLEKNSLAEIASLKE